MNQDASNVQSGAAVACSAWLEPDIKRAVRPQFSEDKGKLLVRATYKRDLPKQPGLYPMQFVIGAFGWRWWGLADQWGRFLTQNGLNEPRTRL